MIFLCELQIVLFPINIYFLDIILGLQSFVN